MNGRWVWEWTKLFLIAFGFFLVIRTFLVEAFTIPTGSMENTLLVGDFLLVNRAVFGAAVPFTRLRTPALRQPERGDIVVFIPSHEPGMNYVKRLVGMPGDPLAMYDRTLLFVLGDNRDDSEDSRFWGFVERERIRGRPLVVYYSFDPASPRRVPWLTGIRWGSIGQRVH